MGDAGRRVERTGPAGWQAGLQSCLGTGRPDGPWGLERGGDDNRGRSEGTPEDLEVRRGSEEGLTH